MDLKGFSCLFRDQKWVPSFLNTGSGVSQNWGDLVFHMALLNGEDLALAKCPPSRTRSHAFYALRQSIKPAWPRQMSSAWVPTCPYGQRWSRSPISPCCCSWRNAWPVPPPSCGTTARFTPSSPITGKTQAGSKFCAR